MGDEIAFLRHEVAPQAQFTAVAAFDVNKDGRIDIVCGSHWYEAPDWRPHFIREVEVYGGRLDGYAHLPYDVNSDGWTDIVTVNYRSRSIKWIEHPGAPLGPWTTHVVDQPDNMETGRLYDVDGDGRLDVLPNGIRHPTWWSLVPAPDFQNGAEPRWLRHDLPPEVAGHGIGFGDINGDGRGDVVGPLGWAEAPQDRRGQAWHWHSEFDLGSASIPILVVDVDEDGDCDLVFARAHDFGVYWLEQKTSTEADRQWVRHAIDTGIAGAHSPLWADLDRDGREELIVGKRHLAHEGRDPGEYDVKAVYRYQFDPATRTWRKWLISWNEHVALGLDPKVLDLDGDGDLDLVAADRDGLYWLENRPLERADENPAVVRYKNQPEYTDHLNLLVVKGEDSIARPVQDAFDWGLRRAHIVSALEKTIGPLPGPHARVPLNVQVASEEASKDFILRRITYATDSQNRAFARLLIPVGIPSSVPAVLCRSGREAGAEKRKEFAESLARAGFICLMLDESETASVAGTSIANDSMRAVWNNIRVLDLLESLPEVDIDRVACIGHGISGQHALFTAVYDQRVAAVVVSCGVTSLRELRKNADESQPLVRYVPELSRDRVAFDFHELVAAVAPRPIMIHAAAQDNIFGIDGVNEVVASARKVYQFHRAESALRVFITEGEVLLPDEARAAIFQWLEGQLKRD
jgi:hypothetical protein